MKIKKIDLSLASVFLLVFFLWTGLVCVVDVQGIGPNGSEVGFAAFNGFIHNLTGVNMWLYDLTDLLSIIPFVVIFSFALLGLVQWITRKRLLSVDQNIFVLGGFYVVVMAIYLLFEVVTLNYRPVLIEGVLEGSYPSSTTMLVMCVMPTAIMQLNHRISHKAIRYCVFAFLSLFTAFMVIGRLISGVHWVSDIIGGAFLSTGLVLLYRAFAKYE